MMEVKLTGYITGSVHRLIRRKSRLHDFFIIGFAALLLLISVTVQADATLLSHYNFDVCSNGDLGNDSLGNSNGTLSGGVALNKNPPSGKQTCSAATFSGGTISVTGLPVSTSAGDKTSISFWMYWDGTNGVMPIGWNLYDLWFNSGHFGFNSASGDLYGISSAGLANGWHHVVAVFTNGNVHANKMYIDGAQKVLTQRRGAPNNARAVVGSSLRISGWLASSGYRFSGHLDEVKVYKDEMTQLQVNADFTYGELNCVVCPPEPPPVLIGHYQFNACSSSDLGEDTLGLHDGVNSGGVIVGKTPPSGKPETCTDGIFSGGAIDINGLPVSLTAGDKTSVSFWMYWDGVNSIMPVGWYSYDLYFTSSQFGFNTGGGDIYGISSNGLANGWHHVAAVFTNGNVRENEIYIDGVSQTLTHLRGTIQNNNAIVNSHFRIGGWWRTDTYRFSGRIDELKVYNGKMTQTEVDADRAYTLANCLNCPPPPPAELKSYYSFNEKWISSVIDVIGGHNGVVSGNISRVSSGPGGLKGDTCYAADFNGGAIDINGLPLSTTSGEKNSISFWMYWNGQEGIMPLGWQTHDLWFASGAFGFNTGGGDVYGISSNGLANSWHHISVVFTNGSVADNEFYLDGVKQSLSLRRGTIRNSNAHVASHLRLGGWWRTDGYRFRGKLDDVKVYAGEITEEQVLADMRANGCLIAEWRMDESDWDGSANEVKDNTANGYHGTAANGVSTVSVTTAGGGVCRVGQFSDNGYVGMATIPHMTDSFSITGWFNTNDRNKRGQRLFVDDEKNNVGGYAISIGDLGAGRIRFYHRSLRPVSLDSSSVIANNQWYFVAAVLTVLPADQATKELYIYDVSGNLLEHATDNVTGSMRAAIGSAAIGGEVNGSGEEGNRFDGYLDEVKAFSKALSAAEISSIINNERIGNNWDGSSRTCGSSCLLANLTVVQSDHSLACPQVRASVDITAKCAGNVIKTDYAGTINLDSNKSGSEFYTSITGGSSINSITFQASDSGTKTLYLYHNQEESIVVRAVDSFPDPDITGIGNATDFRAFGFSASAIGVQTSCVNSASYQLTAFGKLPGNTGCDVIENFSGNKNLKIWFDYANPSSNSSGTLVKVNGNNIPISESATTGLTFTNGRSDFQINYPDAGQIRLHFKYDIDPYDGDPNQAMFSDTNAFVVKPEKLFVYASDSAGAADASAACAGTSCTKFKKAEEDFYLTIRAACADNTITPNFNFAGDINLSSVLQRPALGSGNISVASFNGLANGQKIINQSFNDAGILTINASINDNYLGETLNISGASENIGRFYPSYLSVIANTPVIQEACTAGGNSFTYMGQAFSFSVEPELTITAKSLNDNIVYNYSNKGGDNFWKLSVPAASDRSYSDTSGHAVLNDSDAVSDDVVSPVGTASFLVPPVIGIDTREDNFDGSATLTITGDFLKYDRVLTAPFDSQFDLEFSAASLTDNDSVCYQLNALGGCLSYPISINSSAEQRRGRLSIKNAYGSELVPLTVPLFSEYYTSSGFVVNTDDACTTLSTSNLSLSHTTLNGVYSTTPTIGNIPFVAGVADLSFTAPGASNTGYTDIQLINIDNWLLDAPSGRASFGQYKRSKRLIYIREVY